MHKKLASDLTSLAHSILQMKNKDDVFALKQKAYEVYEKLSVLAYVEEYINTTPNATSSKEELIAKIAAVEVQQKENLSAKEEVVPEKEEPKLTEIEQPVNELDDEELQLDAFAEDVADDVIDKIVAEDLPIQVVEELIENEQEPEKETKADEITEQPFDELEQILFSDDAVKDEATFIETKKTPTLEDELQDTLSVDVTANLFEKAEPKKSLNDTFHEIIHIGLNDRIAFVKNLFDGNQEEFNRAISQINTIRTEKEAKNFIYKNVKPDYDWSDKEEYEIRFFELIAQKFK